MLFTQGKTECKPAEVGYDEGRIEAVHKHFQRLIDIKEIQCAAYCVSRHGKIFMHGAIGKRSFKAEDETPLSPDCVNYVASVTKVFTAVAIMKLVEDGITRLDVPVGAILPQFNTPPYNGITLFQLLTHTSGLHADGGCFPNKYQTNYWDMIEKAYKLHDSVKDGDFDWIAAALGTIGCGFRTKPDTEWAYCSFGFTILGAVIEKLTGIHAHKYIEDNITKPLGMKDTAFDISKEMAQRFIISSLREDIPKRLENALSGKVEADPLWDQIPDTGGGLNSTVVDLVQFGNMMLSGGTLNGVRILGRKTVEKMTTMAISLPNYCWGGYEKERYYGVGFDMRNGPAFTHSQGTFMHEGWGYCSLYMDPKEDMAAAWFVPFTRDEWFPSAQYSVQNVIWSGIM